MKLPSKQYEFGGYSIIFELKFIRGKQGITKKLFNERILEDVKKIEGLFEKLDRQGLGNQVFCFFVVFSITNKRCREFLDYLRDHGEDTRNRILYCTGEVDMDNITKNKREFPDPRTLGHFGNIGKKFAR